MNYNVLVRLKIPDNTAFTTHQALLSMGLKVDKVERAEWYEIETTLNETDVKKLWETTDILANTNKHKVEAYATLPSQSIIVWDKENAGHGVLTTLKKRFNITNITAIKKGVWWNIHTSENKKKIVEELLHSKHYQAYEIY